jgi:hypothetical protein
MKLQAHCEDRESDLLLHSLGELPYWRSWIVSLHVSRCHGCRREGARMLAVSGKIARALSPSGGSARLARPAVTVARGWMAVACVAAAVGLLVLAGSVAVVRYRALQAQAAAQQDIPCRPDLRNDKCR